MRIGTATSCYLFVSSAYASVRSTKCRAADSADPQGSHWKVVQYLSQADCEALPYEMEKGKIDTLVSVMSQVPFPSELLAFNSVHLLLGV